MYETLVTVMREASYGQPILLRGGLSKYLSPPSLGKIIFLCVYWLMILIFLWKNVILSKDSPMIAYKWEIVGFRAAWVSVTQVPLIYCLSCRMNVISIITGISYERLNWFHRWAACTLFLTVIVHWSFFFREWYLADFVKLELQLMPMVKYGLGAWSVNGWMVITGFGAFRDLSYEIWVVQHILGGVVLLWLLYTHVPSYAQYNIWMAIGFLVFDRVARVAVYLTRNLRWRSGKLSEKGPIGYPAETLNVGGGVTLLRIKEVDFTWRPGQHIYINVPRLRFVETHPFTIANLPPKESNTDSREIELFIKAHRGFTKHLAQHVEKSSDDSIRVCLDGPWGSPPLLDSAETLIFLATSNRASYTTPIFLATSQCPGCVKRICFVWIVREAVYFQWFLRQIRDAIAIASRNGVDVNVQFFVTDDDDCRHNLPEVANHAESEEILPLPSKTDDFPSEKAGGDSSGNSVKDPLSSIGLNERLSTSSSSDHENLSESVQVHAGRPRLDRIIRPVVEDAWGHTAIISCCNPSLQQDLRNYVMKLSDERAIHKGTGAQGLSLWCEESW